jgi:hypothetical protein
MLAGLILTVGGVATAGAAGGSFVVYEGGEGPGAGKHIVLVSGDEEYRSEEALPMLGQILARHHGFRCTVLFAINPEDGTINPDDRASIPGLEALADADMAVLFLRFRHLPDEDMRWIVQYVASGQPLLGIRTATHAFNYGKDSASRYHSWSFNSKTWPGGFGRQVLGETWVNHHGHHGKEATRGVIPEAQQAHPILRGVDDVWGPTDVYGIRDLPADATVLLEGSVVAGMNPEAPPVDGPKNNPRMPIVWIRERQLEIGLTQRVICSTIGASMDLQSAGLRRVMVNACYWGVGLEDQIPEKSNVDPVNAYKPTNFGFGTFQRGVRPADHEISE